MLKTIAGAGLALVLLAGCGGDPDRSVKVPPNKDPHQGWVIIEKDSWGRWELRYRCLGNDMLVQDDGESPEVVKDADKCL